MSLIESVRDLVKGFVADGPAVGDHDTTTPAAASEPDIVAVDDVDRLRREWEQQPGHH